MDVQRLISLGGTAFEAVGVAVLLIGSVIALARCIAEAARGQPSSRVYRELRFGLARAILLGLELLVAADIVQSVAVEPTFESVGVLGLIVVVRTFLSWSLEVEITGRWPWHRAGRAARAAAGQARDR
jgi:uncharacterized membrane protein